MPTVVDTDETIVKIPETQLNPIFTQHFVYPFVNNVDTSLIVKLMNKNVPMLLDTGAHVSVLPKRVLLEVFGLPVEGHAKRQAKVFGGQEILLDGPLNLNVTISGLHIVRPFYFVDAEIPIIGGYDLLREAHIVIDTKSAQAWSEHPDVANRSSFSDKVFSMV